ncbi:MAG: YhdP family protein [Gammaproteobacteria bacterium]
MTTAILAVAFAVMLSSVRLLLPLTENYRAELQELIAEAVGRPVRVGRTAARWNRFGPELALFDVEIRDPEDTRPILHFAEMHIGVDLVAAIGQLDFLPTSIRVAGLQLEVERLADGRVGVQGIAADGGSDEANAEGLRGGIAWLFSRERLMIEDLDLTLVDRRRRPERIRLSDIDLELRNSGELHQLAGRVQLTTDIGRQIEFALSAEGPATEPDRWRGEIYLSVSALQLSQVARQVPQLRNALEAGEGDLAMWGELAEGRVGTLTGRLALTGLVLQGETERRRYPALSGNFFWRREASGWAAKISRLVVNDGVNAWPAADYDLRYRAADDRQPLALAARLSYLNIDSLASLVSLVPAVPEKWRTALTEMQPAGVVENLTARIANHRPLLYQVSATVRDVAVQRWERFPGASGVSGILQADQRGGRLNLDSEALSLDLSRWFEHPLPPAKARAQLSWQRTDTGWRFRVEDAEADNADARAIGVAEAEWHKERGLFLDLSVFLEEGRGASISPYLPEKRVPVNTLKWLQRGIVDGRVPRGAFVYRGWGRRYPFSGNDGRLHVDFDVEEAVLDYLPGWPRLEAIKANVEFDQTSMRIRAEAARSGGALLSKVRAEIPNLKNRPTLSLSGMVEASVPDALQFLGETPLTRRFRDTLLELQTAGEASMALAIEARLKKGSTPKVDGRVQITAGRVALPGWPAGVEAIAGELRFSEKWLRAKGLRAKVLARDATVDIDVPIGPYAEKVEQGAVTLRGSADEKGLRTLIDHPVAGALAGSSRWEAVWHVPSREGHRNRLEVSSSLAGLAINTPAPLGKRADERRRLRLTAELTGPGQSRVHLRYGEVLDAALQFARQGGRPYLQRGEVRLGGGNAYLPAQSGLLVSGDLERFPFYEWRRVSGQRSGGWGFGSTPLRRVVLRIGELVLSEKSIRDVRIAVAREGGYWRGVLAGEGAKGSVHLPLRQGRAPLVLNLEHLRLTSLPEPARKPRDLLSDPRMVPPLEIRIDQLWLNGQAIGSVILESSPTAEGLRIRQFRVTGEVLTVDAQGDWQGDAKQNRATWEATLKSPDLGKALRALGYAEGIKGGSTEANLVVSWPGSPATPYLARLRGRVSIKVKKGRIIDIEPGAGRIFGLLSVQALPRRLLLDFRDLFLKGFTFDEINGRFRIDNGDAYSDDLLVEGPAAKLKVIGRTGLARRDYDQLVKVDPNLAGTLPLAGWAVGGPTVGAVMLFFERLLGKEFDESSGIYYRVTGSWDDPKVVRVRSEKTDANEDDPETSR